MPDELLVLLVVGSIAWALIELLQADKAAVRSLPKWAWAVVIVLLAPFGPLLWFPFGRPRYRAAAPVGARTAPGSPLRGRRAYVARPAPDDDPEFLAVLNARADQQRRLRRLEEDFGSDGPGTDTDRPD
ncbi:MAG TPA: PLD nuclease N-terminal domain-containing protein [Sporichthyaceae bacterium]|jgi:hypothetical protein|nr:PLD nuclease N-terminal domain-containing protein [Sporichthyaceae bacterium]